MNRETSVPRIDVPELMLCKRCAYELRGLPSGACPECGKWFDPNDSMKFHGSLRARRQQRLMVSLRSICAVLSVLTFLFGCTHSNYMMGDWRIIGTLGAACVVLIVPVVWLVSLIFLALNKQLRRVKKNWFPFIFGAAIWVLAIASARYGISDLVRTAASNGALVKAAKAELAAPSNSRSRWIGVVPVHETFVQGGLVYFVTDTGWIDFKGIVYSPKGPPFAGARRVYGDWYQWED